MSYLAPAGTAMGLGDVFGGFARGLAAAKPDAALAIALARYSGAAQCWPLSSGRAAMTVLLSAMKQACRDAGRDEVIVPAYTCYSVAASVARAGLKLRLCDVDPATFGLDPAALERADFRRVLAVVSANLYGIPNALTDIERIARERGVFMLDDAAQALGARLAGRAVGTFGDAGLYSFDKGKIICTIQGGAMVARNGALADAIGAAAATLPASTFTESTLNSIKLLVYVAGLRPFAYGLIRRLPFLGLGRTEYEPRYPIARLSRLQSGVAQQLLPRVDELNRGRREQAARLGAALAGVPGIALPVLAAGSEAVYARYPLRVLDPEARDRSIAALEAVGIGATASYPQALADVPGIVPLLAQSDPHVPGARALAREIVTLPTHGFCPPDLAPRVRAVLDVALGSAHG